MGDSIPDLLEDYAALERLAGEACGAVATVDFGAGGRRPAAIAAVGAAAAQHETAMHEASESCTAQHGS